MGGDERWDEDSSHWAIGITGETFATKKLEAAEETLMPLGVPGFEHVQLVTTVVDNERGLVRVRIMTNAKRAGIGKVSGDVLDELEILLGATARTTKLPQNLTIRVVRIGMRRAR